MEPSTSEQRERVASLIEAVAEGTISAAAAISQTESEQWKDFPWGEKLFQDAYHALWHFRSDEDIRARDAEYAAWQIAGLKSLADRLRAENVT
jgi:hypothetical protein